MFSTNKGNDYALIAEFLLKCAMKVIMAKKRLVSRLVRYFIDKFEFSIKFYRPRDEERYIFDPNSKSVKIYNLKYIEIVQSLLFENHLSDRHLVDTQCEKGLVDQLTIDQMPGPQQCRQNSRQNKSNMVSAKCFSTK